MKAFLYFHQFSLCQFVRVGDIFRSFIIMFIFVVAYLHKHLGAMYGRWVDVLITWSALKFIVLRYSIEFQCHVLYKIFIVLFGHGRQ